jgi:hypothetical protein
MNLGSLTFRSARGSEAASKKAAQSMRGVIFWRSAKDVLWSVAFGSRRLTRSSVASASAFSCSKTARAAARAASFAYPASTKVLATCSLYFARASSKRASGFR